MIFARVVALGAALLLAGCGTVCDRLDAAGRGINEKGKPCGSFERTPLNTAGCNANLSSCSPDDVQKLNAYADCLERQPYCSSATSFSWEGGVVLCAQALIGVSSACSSSIF